MKIQGLIVCFIFYLLPMIRIFTLQNLCNLFCLALSLWLVACGPTKKESTENQNTFLQPAPPPGEDYFVDVTHSSGINFKHSIGDDHLSNIIESVGGGAAFLDYDQDGWLDLYVTSGNYHKRLSDPAYKPSEIHTNHLYHNNGDGTFADVTAQAGVGDTGFSMGVTVGDINNDGYPDIYVSNHGPNVLYQNKGDGTFTDISSKAGVAGNESSVGSVWLDYDRDGLIDLYVGNYLHFDPDYKFYYAPDGFPGPMSFDGEADKLYRNLGNGKFADVTKAAGMYNPNGRAMGVGAADYDGDGFMDIYVANDHMVNSLYHNLGGKQFEEVGIPSGTAFNQVGEGTISMAVDFADYNHDGLLDFFVSDDGYCSLYKNNGKGLFSEMAYPSGIAVAAAQHVGWSSSFIDYDNDGDVDIFKVNGELKHLYGQEDQLFDNDGQGNFTDVSVERGTYFTAENVGRGACFGDYDNDGDIDAYILNLNDYGVLLRNDQGNENHWVALKLIGTRSNRDALGARISLWAGTLFQTAQQKSTTGYLSQNDQRIHFGLGVIDHIDSLEIVWPAGGRQTIKNPAINRVIKVKEEQDD